VPHPNVHPRRAYLCLHKDCVPPRRVFVVPGEPDPPNCPDGHGKMALQANVPYSVPDTSQPIGQSRMLGSKPKRRRPTRPSGDEAA
jgi:hypothetical protein